MPTFCARPAAHLDSRSLAKAEEAKRFGLCFKGLVAYFPRTALGFTLLGKRRLFIFGHLRWMLTLNSLCKGFTQQPPTSDYSLHILLAGYSATRPQCPCVFTTPG